MTELKTLKDITPYDKMSNDGSYQDMIDKNELRQEAIKHIKALVLGIHNKGNMPKYNVPYDFVPDWILNLISGLQIVWIKHFFNISEKELSIEEK